MGLKNCLKHGGLAVDAPRRRRQRWKTAVDCFTSSPLVLGKLIEIRELIPGVLVVLQVFDLTIYFYMEDMEDGTHETEYGTFVSKIKRDKMQVINGDLAAHPIRLLCFVTQLPILEHT